MARITSDCARGRCITLLTLGPDGIAGLSALTEGCSPAEGYVRGPTICDGSLQNPILPRFVRTHSRWRVFFCRVRRRCTPSLMRSSPAGRRLTSSSAQTTRWRFGTRRPRHRRTCSSCRGAESNHKQSTIGPALYGCVCSSNDSG